MKNPNCDHVIGFPVSSITYAVEEMRQNTASVPEPVSPQFHSTTYRSSLVRQKNVDSVIDWMSKLSKKANDYAQGIREHVILGPKISETVKGKLSLGTRILRAGGLDRVFRRNFSVTQGEKLLKAFQCHLSTSAGPISGLLFISTEKIAFHSDRFLTITSPKGNVTKVPYKVLIPLNRIKKTSMSENINKPSQKYIQIVTVDDFEFWFMGFVNFQRSLKCLQQVISDL